MKEEKKQDTFNIFKIGECRLDQIIYFSALTDKEEKYFTYL